MAQIFSFLDPLMLLQASRASRAWRERVLDSGLWKQKFKTEGWGLDFAEIERFENNCNQSSQLPATKAVEKITTASSKILERSAPAVHSRENAQKPFRSLPRASRPLHVPSQASQFGDLHAEQSPGDDTEMFDVGATSPGQSRTQSAAGWVRPEFSKANATLNKNEIMIDSADLGTQQRCISSGTSRLSQHLMTYASPGVSRINYHHVFKQKRKLEENWNSGQYRSFQLPHRDHPEDAHTECVYTIQYSRNHLVSGSRDRTLRIWNIDTQRLVREPLQGHTGSVLCLQFDDREEEDVIISGSSDTHVILWQFSTGKMLKQLTNAHRESVLNLKFDKRFLVTCSKDKMIKIWSRHELRPGHRDYPVKNVPRGGQCPAYILDMANIANTLRNGQPNFENNILEPYTHLMTLELHGAAVNAIQIFKDQLVSASGDRNLRVWDIHTGECLSKIDAHGKGIACVQYDGKRIVSGSSDNAIKIWDPVSKSEVARLDGHTRLVRTIQAAFADYPGGRERLEAEALEVQREWQAASIAGLIPPPSERRRPGKPGSRKPRDIKSVGAKIPPSGGGSRWGRIVSGSYDETIIIWKKTENDEWVIGQRLRQDDALRAAGPPLIPRSDAQAQAQAQANPPNHAFHHQQGNQAPPNFQAIGVQGPLPAHQIVQNAAQASSWNNPALPVAYRRLLRAQQHGNAGPSAAGHQYAGPSNAPQNGGQGGNPQQQPGPRPPPFHAQHLRPAVPPSNSPPGGQPNARVFKLQFDARRIICCSQDPKIVGWDFANGDEQIIECSRFFAAPQ